MYLLLVTNHELLRNFAAEAEVSDGHERVQRDLDRKHYKDIVGYITENPADYLLGAMTYAIDTVDASDFIAAGPGSNIGTLVLPTSARMRCLDGQHRRAAIAEAVSLDESVGDDYSAVVLYVEDDYMKRRQMFSDMNATPKVVSKALNITFDSRDPYAKAAQHLADQHPLLAGVVETRKARITTTDAKIFSLAGVYDGLKRFDLGMVLPRGRSPKNKTIDELIEIGTTLFDTIQAAFPEFQEAKDKLEATDDVKEQADLMRQARRSTILFSTTTLRVVSGALHEAMKVDDENDPAKYIGRLAKIDFAPTSKLFASPDVGFVTGSGTPSARNQEVFAATKALTEAIRIR
ncbi:DNA sulfur modification protein DndB [Cellulomonas sp. McL0617]|uniref:DNA sulfur modification protein DndB n=1 Tax=Cellulomonas sp. McL0617 TaxID=3415675 RepID=UPI003CEF6A75